MPSNTLARDVTRKPPSVENDAAMSVPLATYT